MPKLLNIGDDSDTSTKPLSRQASVQSTKSVNSVITTSEVSENQSSAVGATTPAANVSLSRVSSNVGANTSLNGSLSRTSSVKRDSMISRSSASGDQEPLMEQTETTELLSEL